MAMLLSLAALSAVGVVGADYTKCDLTSCTCAGVSLAEFEKGGPYKLREAGSTKQCVACADAPALRCPGCRACPSWGCCRRR